MPGWVWDIYSDQWEDGFRHLKEFSDRESHARVPNHSKSADGFNLGNWVANQRTNIGILSTENKERLEALPGWSWDVLSDKWEEGFRHLKEYVDQEGDAKVPSNCEAVDGYQIGNWVAFQRVKKDKLSRELKAKLESLPGWNWDALTDKWEEGFRYLQEFADREGHAKPPSNFKAADGYPVGSWVGKQRQTKGSMPPARKARLEVLPGWSWNTLEDAWEEGFRHLSEFADQEEHCRVPIGFKTADGYGLGVWVSVQRLRKDRLEKERLERLIALPGWSWDPHAEKWEIGFKHLQGFASREGHCLVFARSKTSDGYQLGNWVSTQRLSKEKLSQERKARLEALPGWVWRVK